MKRTLCILLLLSLLPLAALSESESRFAPGLERGPAYTGYARYSDFSKKHSIASIADPRYTPELAKPLNAYIITHPSCMVGINRSGMYKVEDKGLVNDITKYLNEWANEITEASQGAIRFTSFPDQVDILLVADQRFVYKGQYRGGGKVVKGHTCKITLTAYRLTNDAQSYSITKSNVPGKSVSINGSGDFWMYPPEFKGSKELKSLVQNIMGWYGYDTAQGKNGPGVESARKALIDRGYLKAEPGISFDKDMEAAVRLLQADYGLKETGEIDRATLVALYYDKASVETMLNKYPAEE